MKKKNWQEYAYLFGTILERNPVKKWNLKVKEEIERVKGLTNGITMTLGGWTILALMTPSSTKMMSLTYGM